MTTGMKIDKNQNNLTCIRFCRKWAGEIFGRLAIFAFTQTQTMRYKSCILFIILLPSILCAQTSIDSLLRELQKMPPDTNRVNALDNLSFIYSNINPDSGLSYGLQAKQLAESLGWKKGVATAYSDMAINHEAKAEHSLALEYHLKALHQFKELGLKRKMAAVLSNMSIVCENQGDYAAALSYTHDALALFEELNDTVNAAITWETSGRIYMRQGVRKTAVLYYSTALAMHRTKGNKPGEARVLGYIGILKDEEGQYEEALSYHNQALAVNQQENNTRGEQINLMNIGIVHCHLKDYGNALRYQLRALHISEASGRPSDIAVNSGNIGETYYHLANSLPEGHEKNDAMHSAISYLENAVAMCRTIQYHGPMLEFGKLLSEAYASTGTHNKAFTLFKEVTIIQDSIDAHDQLAKLHDLDTKREIALKEKQLQIQQNQIEIGQLTAMNKRNERMLLLAGIGILLLIGSYVFIRVKRKAKQHQDALSEIAFIQSHEIRAPVARILGLVPLLEKDRASSTDAQVLSYIHSAALELDGIIRKVVNHTSGDNAGKQSDAIRVSVSLQGYENSPDHRIHKRHRPRHRPRICKSRIQHRI
jgi:tetratricopeptide (TPR) repeat protein